MDQLNAHFPSSQKFWKFHLEVRWNWPFVFGPTVIFGTTLAGAHFDWSYRSDRNVPFPFPFQNVFPVPVFCILFTGSRTKRAVALVHWARGIFFMFVHPCLFCIGWLLIPCFNVLIWWQFPLFIFFLISLHSSRNPCFYHGIWGSVMVRSPLHNMT